MLRIDNLRTAYEGVEVLRGVSLSVPRGSLTALVGANGSGKTTLLKAAAGLLKPTAGEVWLDGAALSTLSRREVAARVSYMPQSRPAPGITVRHLTGHGRYPHLRWGHSMTAADRQIVRRAMDEAGVTALAGRTLNRLSGGERQRAYLAMMLAQQTPLMLLDEPTTYLDLSAQFEMMALLRRQRDAGHAILAVLHDLGLALGSCDHIVMMRGGEIAAQGAPEEILAGGWIERLFGVRAERTPSGAYAFLPVGRRLNEE